MFWAMSTEDPERIELFLARHEGDLVAAATIMVRVGQYAWYSSTVPPRPRSETYVAPTPSSGR